MSLASEDSGRVKIGARAKKGKSREGVGRRKIVLFYHFRWMESASFLRDFDRRSQESTTKHHLDLEKPNLHLLSTHQFTYAIYKTGFV